MKRRLFNLAAAMSLLLCILTAGLWARSYWWALHAIRMTTVSRQQQAVTRSWHVTASQGGIRVALLKIYSSAPLPTSGSSSSGWQWFQGPPQMELGGLPRFMHQPTTMPQPGHAYFLICPFWLMVIGLAILPATWLVRRHRKAKHGVCPSCGYDLRATPERCPECGTVGKPQPAEGAAA